MPDALLSAVELVEWRPLVKGSLLGFAKVRLGSLIINEVAVFQGNGSPWAGMPGRPLIGADGVAMRDGHGKQRYVPIVEWASREAGSHFSRAVIAAIGRKLGSAFAALEGSVEEAAEKPVPRQQEGRQPAPKGTRQHREKVSMGESDIVPF